MKTSKRGPKLICFHYKDIVIYFDIPKYTQRRQLKRIETNHKNQSQDNYNIYFNDETYISLFGDDDNNFNFENDFFLDNEDL